jgi:hypothetical protein
MCAAERNDLVWLYEQIKRHLRITSFGLATLIIDHFVKDQPEKRVAGISSAKVGWPAVGAQLKPEMPARILSSKG